ncbi:MAG: hypothetical protein RLZZ70_433 [Candidatus Parcubacteria bacterium]|jgi:hypothetical protein
MNKINKAIVVVLCLVFISSNTPVANAATTQSRINELQATINRLQAELNALLRNQDYTLPTTGAVTTGIVIQTGTDSVEFSGSVSSVVRAERGWFEYGPSRSLAYSTIAADLNSSRGQSFRIQADDFDRNRTYYYRAVTEDRFGNIREGVVRTFSLESRYNYNDDYDDWDDEDDYRGDRPEVDTDDALRITSSAAEIRGEIDMNDGEDGVVFFVYGEDEDLVDEVTDEDSYGDIDTDGDDLQKIRIESGFDGNERFFAYITGLDNDTEQYYRMCVAYEDEDGDDAIECGSTESFETDR